MNAIARLEYELAYYDSAIHRFNHYTTRTPTECFNMTISETQLYKMWQIRFKILRLFKCNNPSVSKVLNILTASSERLEPPTLQNKKIRNKKKKKKNMSWIWHMVKAPVLELWSVWTYSVSMTPRSILTQNDRTC